MFALAACSMDGPTSPGVRASIAPPAHDPILFVHGWNANASTWTTMVSRFKADGWTDAEIVNWSYNFNQSNTTTAANIKSKVDSILAVTGASRVDIITHSMGTLSAHYYIKNLGGDGKVDAIVSLAGPNHGTQTAVFCGSTSCVEMRPNSKFLSTLNRKDETPGASRWLTWWSSCDQVILPQTSTILSGATNTQTACLQHSAQHEDFTVYQQVRNAVNPGFPVVAVAGQ
jgi:triacylglycerol lipase